MERGTTPKELKRESKDLAQKNLEAFPDVAADILNVFVYGGKPVVKAENLLAAPTETEYAAPGDVLRNQLEDVSKYEMLDGRIRVQYLLSNQSGEDSAMILRKAGYVGAVYREQYDGKAEDRFPVISLLLYWGKGHWNTARTVKGFFRRMELSPQLLKLADNIRLHVFEMRNLPSGVRELFQSDMRLVVDYLAEGDGFCSDRPVVHKEALVRLLRALGGDRKVEDTALILEKMNVKEEDGITMCELFDQYTRRGRQEGRQEGMQAWAALTNILLSSGQIEDLRRASQDSDYRNRLFEKYGIFDLAEVPPLVPVDKRLVPMVQCAQRAESSGRKSICRACLGICFFEHLTSEANPENRRFFGSLPEIRGNIRKQYQYIRKQYQYIRYQYIRKQYEYIIKKGQATYG